MKVAYKGFDIEVTKEKCLAGYKLHYFSIFRQSDGFEVESGISDDGDTIRTWIGMMKGRVDGFIENPNCEICMSPDDEDYYDEMSRHRLENEKTQKLV